MNRLYMGIDVQKERGSCFAVMNDDGAVISSGWFQNPGEDIVKLLTVLTQGHKVSVGIDAPRQPLPSPREWYWDRNGSRWRKRLTQRGYGRHCEIVISAHRLANPQWTPIVGEAPSWMVVGFDLFRVLEGLALSTHEVFPTASYSLLYDVTDVRVSIDFSSCMGGPKDMLDAFVGAVTVREFVCGRGEEVGGGDGLGTIILPRPLPVPVIREVLIWPESKLGPSR